MIPSRQFDPGATAKMMEMLDFGQVEIERAQSAFSADGRQFDGGSYVMRMQQPYSSFAKTLLERQNYPDLRVYPGGPPKRPYDVTAQTLPLLMGVSVETVARPFNVELKRMDQFRSAEADSLRGANVYSWRTANGLISHGDEVWRSSQNGDFSLQGAAGMKPYRRPRIAVYQSWVPSMDEGWTRWLLEQFGFPYTSAHNRDIQAGNLREHFDVIVFPEQTVSGGERSAGVIHSGYRPGAMPEEYVGGLGDSGAEALKKFVAQGGTLVFLNDASGYAIEYLGVPARNVVAGLPNRDYYSPGSILSARLEAGHPLALGLPRNISIWSENSPVFEIPESARSRAVAVYPPTGILASGWLLGERHLANRAALLDIPMGAGRVILFGMRPQYRAQSYQTFKLFFNSLVAFE